jgi:hypothetical protein
MANLRSTVQGVDLTRVHNHVLDNIEKIVFYTY